jgi:ADP-heptose:LPS heptosyltransferase
MVAEKDGPDLWQFNLYFKKLRLIAQNLINAYDGIFINTIGSKVKYVVCSPGYGGNVGDQSSERRKLPLDRWKEVIAKCKALGYRVVLTGAPSEIEVLSPISDLVDYNFIGKTKFLDLLYLMRKSWGVITTDNGQFHIATMAGSRVLSIFGPTNFLERVPPDSENIFQINKSLPICSPCHDGRLVFECKHNICMTNFNSDSLEKYLL